MDATGPNLLQVDPESLGPVVLTFKTQTYNLEFHNTNVLGGRHALTAIPPGTCTAAGGPAYALSGCPVPGGIPWASG